MRTASSLRPPASSGVTLWVNVDKPKIVRERNTRLLRATEKLSGALNVHDDGGITAENAWKQVCWRSGAIVFRERSR